MGCASSHDARYLLRENKRLERECGQLRSQLSEQRQELVRLQMVEKRFVELESLDEDLAQCFIGRLRETLQTYKDDRNPLVCAVERRLREQQDNVKAKESLNSALRTTMVQRQELAEKIIETYAEILLKVS